MRGPTTPTTWRWSGPGFSNARGAPRSTCTWPRAGRGQSDRALRAAEAAFRAAPSLSAYLKAQELAGERWAEVSPGLLENLRQSHAADAKVDVFLDEGLIDDAIAAVKDGYSYGLL